MSIHVVIELLVSGQAVSQPTVHLGPLLGWTTSSGLELMVLWFHDPLQDLQFMLLDPWLRTGKFFCDKFSEWVTTTVSWTLTSLPHEASWTFMLLCYKASSDSLGKPWTTFPWILKPMSSKASKFLQWKFLSSKFFLEKCTWMTCKCFTVSCISNS